MDTSQLLENIKLRQHASIAKALSIVENKSENFLQLLTQLNEQDKANVIGITGAPGAGKSTIINALLHILSKKNKTVAVLSVDPSSPFNKGALLGDRIRMSDFFLNQNIFIRSVASRGALGGLCAHIIEMIAILKAANFDYIIIETVGVGQNEVDVATIADTTIVLLTPDAGDEIQTMKSGLMEIADILVINKSDKPEADSFFIKIKNMIHEKSFDIETPVIKTIATENQSVENLFEAIEQHQKNIQVNQSKKLEMMANKAFQLIQQKRMQEITKESLVNLLKEKTAKGNFNLFQFAADF